MELKWVAGLAKLVLEIPQGGIEFPTQIHWSMVVLHKHIDSANELLDRHIEKVRGDD